MEQIDANREKRFTGKGLLGIIDRFNKMFTMTEVNTTEQLIDIILKEIKKQRVETSKTCDIMIAKNPLDIEVLKAQCFLLGLLRSTEIINHILICHQENLNKARRRLRNDYDDKCNPKDPMIF